MKLNKIFMPSLLASAVAVSPASFAQQSDAGFALEEVVVTARKRSESLQETPISITAITAADLEDRMLSSVADIDETTPNLVFDTAAPSSGSNSAASVFIRGVGQVDFTPTTDPGVGIYVDGVYYARAIGSALDFLDVERIEVLRGPQGTLFGRNTIGGALNITSRAPADTFGGNVKLGVGSDSRQDVSVNLDMPISDVLRSKVSLTSKKQDGYVSNEYLGGADLGDDDSMSARIMLEWDATENVSVAFNADYTKEREQSAPNVLLAADETKSFPSAFNASITSGGGCSDAKANPACFSENYIGGTDKTYQGQDSASELDYWGAGLTVDWDLGAFSIKSITAYRDLDSYSTRDADHFPGTIFETTDFLVQDQFSQEFQFSGTAFDDRMNWLLGVYYFEEEASNENFVDISLISILSGGEVENDTKAIFAQTTYDVTDKLALTLGARYTEENKSFTPVQETLTPLGPWPAGTPILPRVEKEQSLEEWTPLVNLAYQWTDDVMTYITYSEGFKSGGYTQRVFPPIAVAPGQNPADVIPDFTPEFVETYEVGFKSTLFDSRLRLNGAMFYTDYSDMHILIREAVASVTVNAAAATMMGFELELTALPTDRLMLQAGIGYLDSEYEDLDARAVGISEDSSFANAPDWSISSSVAYSIPVDSLNGTLTPRLDASYTSEVYNDAINTPELVQGGHVLWNASVSWEDDDEKWHAILGVKNIGDKRVMNSASANMASGGYVEATFNRGREWVLSLNRNF